MTLRPPIQHFDEKKPYIFISYAHKDSAKVDPIINRLQADGFRIWYDCGIRPSSSWVDTIGATLKHSMFFLAFFSKAYFKSKFCMKELRFAQDKIFNSKCILIYLEEAQMDEGTELLVSDTQHISWYQNDERLCYAALYNVEEIGKCNIHGKVPDTCFSSVAGPNAPKRSQTSGARHSKISQSRSGNGASLKKAVIFAACLFVSFLLLRSVVINFIFSDYLRKEGMEEGAGEEGGEQEGISDEVLSDVKKESLQKGAVSLTSIEQPVEADGFQIGENVLNTMGTTYDKAVVVGGVDAAYVRYNVGDFNYLSGTYSVASDWAISDNEYTLQAYLDDKVDEPCIDVKMSRSTVETPINIDVSDAQFITFKMEGYHCSLILSDCILSNEPVAAASEAPQSTGIPISGNSSKTKLISIEQPVESDGFQIAEEVLNTMGTTYDKAVVVNGVDSAYVRYNVGDFSRFTGTYSVDSSWAISDSEYSLLIFLDGNVDEPYANLTLSRSTVETPLDIDVSNAQFITFKMEGYHCSLVLSDCELK